MSEEPTGRKRRGVWKPILQTTLVVLILLLAAVIFLVATAPGGRLIALVINRLGSNEIRSVDVEGLTGLITGDTRLGHLIIADAEGKPWLTLRGIELDWSPLAVLSSGLDIERLHVDEIYLAQLPEGGPEEQTAETATGTFKLPLNIAIDNLDLPDISLGEAVVGTAAELSASGALSVNSDLTDILADLDIKRTDGVGGQAAIEADIDLPEQRFDLDAEISEPAGGVLARLAGLPEDNAVHISAHTTGTLDDWTLDLTGDIDGARAAAAEIALQQTEAGRAFEATARGRLGLFLPAQIASLFEGQSDIVARGVVEPENAGIQFETFVLESASLHAEGQGRLARQGASDFEARVTGVNGPAELALGEGDSRLSLSLSNAALSVTGPAENAAVHIEALLPSLTTSDLEISGLSVAADLEGADLAARSGAGTLRVRAEAVGTGNEIAARALAGAVAIDSSLAFDGTTLTSESSRLQTGTTDVAFSGHFDLSTLSGNARIEGEVNSAVIAADLPDLLGPRIALATDVTLPGDTGIALSGLSVTAETLTAGGELTLDSERNLTASFQADIPEIGAFVPQASGAVAATARLSGTMFEPAFELAATSERIGFDGRQLEEVVVNADGRLEGAVPRIDLELTAQMAGQPVSAVTQLSGSDATYVLNPLTLAVGENRVSGDLTLDSAFRPQGALGLDLSDIASLAALAGLEFTGTGTGTLNFSVENERPEIAADLAVSRLAGPGFSLADASLDATITNYFSTPGIDGRLAIEQVSSGENEVAGIAVDFDFEDGWTRFDATAEEAVGMPVSLTGRVRPADGTTVVELETAQFAYQDLPVRLAEPARISIEDGGAVIDNLVIAPPGGTVSVSGTAGETLDLDIDLSEVPLSIADRFVPDAGLGGEVSGTIEVTGTPAAPNARYDLHATGVTAAAIADYTSRPISLDVAGTFEPEGVEFDARAADGSGLTVDARGRVGLQGEKAVSLTANARTGEEPFRLALGEGEARAVIALSDLDLTVDGSLDNAALRAAATLQSASAAGYGGEAIGIELELNDANLSARSGSGRIRLTAQSVEAENDMVARALAGPLELTSTFTADGNTIATETTRLTGAATTANVSGRYDIAAGTGSGRAAATIDSDALSPGLSARLGPELAASAELALGEQNTVSLTDLTVTAEQLTASGEATIDAERKITARLNAELENVGVLNPKATGALALAANVTGEVGRPQFSLTMDGTDITVDGRPVEDLEVAASGILDPEAPTADVAISGTYLGEPIIGNAKLAVRDGVNVLDPLLLQVEDNRVQGSLTFDEAFRPEGRIGIELPDIGALAALAGVEITGRGEGEIVFSKENDVPRLTADLSIPELAGPGFSLVGGAIDATVEDYLATPGVAGNVSVRTVEAGQTSVTGIDIDVTLEEGGWTRFDGDAQANGSPVSLIGRVRQADGTTVVELSEASATYQNLPIDLVEPARATIEDGTVRIGELTLSPGGGTVAVTGTAGETLDLEIALSDVPLDAVDAFAPGTGLRGAVSGTVEVTGTPADPRAEFDLTATGVSAAALSPVTTNPLAVDVSGTYTGDAVAFRANASEGSGLSLNANGRVGLTGARTLSIEADGTAPFSLVAAQLAARGLVLNGAADLNMRVGGTISAPDFSGTVSASGAQFIDTGTGLAINDLAVDVALTRQSVEVRSLSGELSTGGQLTGSGTIGLDAAAGFPADLSLEVADGRYADGKLVATRFDAALTLTGPLTRQPTLGGSLNLGQTTITVPSALPNSIAQLDVRHRNEGAEVRRQMARLREANAGVSGGGLALDLQINAPNRIFVRGRGIDAEFGGSLRLRGTTATPIAVGGFDLVRGRLELLGKRLDFDSGRITFAGSMVPELDFSASTTAGTATATILVTGPATHPEFEFTSSPDLPDDEVLALLVFGRSLTDLSPIQIAQLASAAAALTGVTDGGGLVEQLRKATGIDNLDIKVDEETGDASVAVGRYLNDRTYLGLEQGQDAGSGKATIDLNLGRGIKLRGEATSGGDTKAGIFFERDY